jgi:hypothetical protein
MPAAYKDGHHHHPEKNQDDREVNDGRMKRVRDGDHCLAQLIFLYSSRLFRHERHFFAGSSVNVVISANCGELDEACQKGARKGI